MLIWCLKQVKNFILKRATKLYFMDYRLVVIIFFNTGLYENHKTCVIKMALSERKNMPPKSFQFLDKVKNFINKERCGSCKTKECKNPDHKIKLFEKIRKNIRQLDFKALVSALYYCTIVALCFSSKTCSKESNNMVVEKTSRLQ